MALWHARRLQDAGDVELRIRKLLLGIGPLLRVEAIGIELVEFEVATGVAVLSFKGDCPGCEMSAASLRDGVEAHLRMYVPEVRAVRALTDVGES